MKKQILFLAIFTLAIFFAGTTKVLGQAIHVSNPIPSSCVGTPLTPIAGVPYPYKAASTQAGDYTFWATKDANFITTVAGPPAVSTTNITTKLNSPTSTPVGTDLVATSANYGVAAAADEVTITWSDAVLNATTAAAPTFVAVVKTGICANNFEAWSITPVNAFTVDILNLENAAKTPIAYGTPDDQCFDIVRRAVYNAGNIEYDFGTQILYYEVVAANFSGSYTPTFTLGGLRAGQTAVIEWAYDNAFTSPVTVTSGTASATPVTTSVANTSVGVSIYVRVTISNTTYEGLTSQTIALDVDGQNTAGVWDIVNSATTCTPTTGADHADIANQTLNPRPTLDAVAPSSPFVPGNDSNN